MSIEYILLPEVPGEFGENSTLDTKIHPPIVKKLHFIFKTWLGDDLVECFPVFLISERLKEALEKTNFKKFFFTEFEQTVDKVMMQLHQTTKIPKFFWFHIGTEKSDFYINSKNQLTVSENAFIFLNKFNLKHCDVEKG